MKLLFIYGSPAVGKLTTAKEVAALTGFKLFHNHVSIDCVRPVFEWGSKPFDRLVDLIRVETIREAARENVDLIYTFCYAKGLDDRHIKAVLGAVEEHGGEVCFVMLVPELPEIEKRVLEKSRAELKKVNSVETLAILHEEYEFFSPVPERESLVIDNTYLTVGETARRIISHFQIPFSDA